MLAALAALVGGCGGQRYVTAPRLERGLVLVYTGIEGRSPFNELICKGLARGGVPYAIELTDWTVGVPGAYLMNLRLEQRNRARAAVLAERVRAYHREHPGRPVFLVGQSGGAAMALWTAETLGADEPVEGVILLAAAISPGYSLDDALARSRRGVVSFYSASDLLFLGMGTTVYGTMDGRHVSSAGRVGFDLPPDGPAPGGEGKFYQVSWRRPMMRAGHWGGHLSTSALGFIRDYIAPLVTAEAWTEPLIERVSAGCRPDAKADEAAPAGFHQY